MAAGDTEETGGYEIRALTPPEIDTAIEWAAAEGWNPGLADAGCFGVVDPSGFWGGFLDGRLVATISVVNYGRRFSFLGFYIVAPGHRGMGLGYRLWQAGMAHAGRRLVGLDGVVDQQDNYRRSGFELAYRNIRHGGVPNAARLESTRADVEIFPVAELTAGILDYDEQVFPASRPRFLDAWMKAPGHVARAAIRDGRVAGFGVIRPSRAGRKVGPLFADDRAVAEGLLADLLAGSTDGAVGDEVFLDVPEPTSAAMALAEAIGLAPVFETARMYTGAAPSIALDRVFGVTSFELG